MSRVTITFNGGQLRERMARPFQLANEAEAVRFTQAISSNTWAWPRPPSPRDIVDTGDLRKSQRGGMLPPAPDGYSYGHSWGNDQVDYALQVHEGYNGMPGRPWTREVIKEGRLLRDFARYMREAL